MIILNNKRSNAYNGNTTILRVNENSLKEVLKYTNYTESVSAGGIDDVTQGTVENPINLDPFIMIGRQDVSQLKEGDEIYMAVSNACSDLEVELLSGQLEIVNRSVDYKALETWSNVVSINENLRSNVDPKTLTNKLILNLGSIKNEEKRLLTFESVGMDMFYKFYIIVSFKNPTYEDGGSGLIGKNRLYGMIDPLVKVTSGGSGITPPLDMPVFWL